MNEPASDVIVARARAHDTLMPTLAWSVAAHAVVVAAIWLAPDTTANRTPRTVMTINLGGAEGPRAGGLTQIGGRAVPEAPPEPPRPVPRTPPPPAPARQAVALPSPKPVPARPARAQSAAAAPSVPEPPREGSTRVETGARGQGFGLATGGTGAKGFELEVATTFCCPLYLEQLRIAIERAWERTAGVTGDTTVRFRILRAGTFDSISIVQPSGNATLDAAAARAVSRVGVPLPLPPEFPDSSLTLRMRFENR